MWAYTYINNCIYNMYIYIYKYVMSTSTKMAGNLASSKLGLVEESSFDQRTPKVDCHKFKKKKPIKNLYIRSSGVFPGESQFRWSPKMRSFTQFHSSSSPGWGNKPPRPDKHHWPQRIRSWEEQNSHVHIYPLFLLLIGYKPKKKESCANLKDFKNQSIK